MTYILTKPEHIASYPHVLLAKKSFPVPAFAYPVRKRLIKTGPEPYAEDTDVKELRLCADKRYFVVAGLRLQHEDKVMLVPFFTPVEKKTGLVVSQEVFQLIDYIATC